jgi:hypothetical protein
MMDVAVCDREFKQRGRLWFDLRAVGSVEGLVYLASPYTHAEAAVRQRRYELALCAARLAMSHGMSVYSPVVYGHTLGTGDWGYWMRHCLSILRQCSLLVVLRLPDWESSRGVAIEVEAAQELGIELVYADFDARCEMNGAPTQDEAVKKDAAPWCGYLHHATGEGNDWGMIRDALGHLIAKASLQTSDENVLNAHRRNRTDPTHATVRFIVSAVNEKIARMGTVGS